MLVFYESLFSEHQLSKLVVSVPLNMIWSDNSDTYRYSSRYGLEKMPVIIVGLTLTSMENYFKDVRANKLYRR